MINCADRYLAAIPGGYRRLVVGRGYILPKPRKRGPLGKASHCGRANNTPVTAAPQCSRELPRTRYFCLLPLPGTQKALTEVSAFCVVGRGRFELPKSETSDLQSDPFGHSGIFPYMKLHRRAPRCLGGQGRASLLRLRNQTAMRFLTMELVIGIEPTTC